MAQPERKIVEFRQESEAELRNLNGIDQSILRQLAENYSRTWANSGIFVSTDEAEKRIASFNPNYSYMLLEPGTNIVLAQIHTIPAFADSILDFVGRFPTYDSVMKAAKGIPPTPSNLIVCFSLNCKEGYQIKKGDETIPLPRFILENLPNSTSAYKIGFSFMTMREPFKSDADSMIDRYLELARSENTRSGGPAMMHEAFGGLVVGFLPHARPELGPAAGGITLVVYPKNEDELKTFERIKEKRREIRPSFTRYNNAVVMANLNLTLKTVA